MWPCPLSFSQTLAADRRGREQPSQHCSGPFRRVQVCPLGVHPLLGACCLGDAKGAALPDSAAGGPFPHHRPNRSCPHVRFANQSSEKWFLCVILVSSQLSIL